MALSHNPLLSICIPTYNRAVFLKQTLECIVSQRIFIETDQIEIVISNNNSTDTTEEVALDFQSRFPDKIVYVRTQETTHSSVNFANVLLHAHGELCKLHNDSVSIQDGFLASVVALIKKNAAYRQPIFFLNGNWQYREETTLCGSVNDFVSHASFYMTWIGGFSIRKEDIPRYIQHFIEYTNHFSQTEILLRFLKDGCGILVYNEKFGEEYHDVSKSVSTKFINEVYIGEYISLLKKYISDSLLSESIYHREITKLLVCFYMPHYYRFAQKFSLIYMNDFSFLKKYIPKYTYYILLLLYPLCACMYPCRKNTKLRKLVAYLCNRRLGRLSYNG